MTVPVRVPPATVTLSSQLLTPAPAISGLSRATFSVTSKVLVTPFRVNVSVGDKVKTVSRPVCRETAIKAPKLAKP